MRTRLLFQLLILSIGSSFAGASEYITFIEGNTLNVPAGKTALIFHFLPSSDADTADTRIHYTPDGGTTAKLPFGSNSQSSTGPMPLVGPATVQIVDAFPVPGAEVSALGLKLVDTAPSLTSNLPSNAVVIPSDANGSVQIILETSIDLITWNAASPGSYASSNPSRFFRVRAVAP